MSKIVILAGSFDCITQKQTHLIKEAYKLAVGGEVYVLLYEDYAYYSDFGSFPIQGYDDRIENLSNFVCRNNILRRDDFKLLNRTEDKKLITFVHYADDKDFPGREQLRENNITIKFIKKYEQ